MITKNLIKGKSEREIKEVILDHSIEECAELIKRLYEEAEKGKPVKRIVLTRKQFEEHFQISTMTGQRGRPRKTVTGVGGEE